MPTLNERAHQLASALAADAAHLGIAVHSLACGTRVIDCGVNAPGSTEAGRRLAEICLSGLGSVAIIKGTGLTLRELENWHPIPFSELDLAFPTVIVMSDQPVAACLASQYAGWEIKDEAFFAMASGPMRAAAGREELFDVIGCREQSDVCVGILEANKLPPDRVCQDLAEKCHIAPERLTLLIARTSSIVGTVQIVARSLETALHKLHVLGFDLNRIASGFSTAPLPPVADSDLTALGRTNDAILYGSYVELSVCGDDASIEQIGPRVPSEASTDYGRPFAEIFKRYDADFYRIDPMLFSPAFIVFVNRDTGKRQQFGRMGPKVLVESFGSPP